MIRPDPTGRDAGAETGGDRGGRPKLMRVFGKASNRLRRALTGDDSMGEDEGEALEQALIERLSTAPKASASSPERTSGSLGIEVAARLTLMDGPGDRMVFELRRVPFTLGRDRACDVSLPELAVQQGRIEYYNGSFVMCGLAESPETRIHGDAVEWALLESGDTIEIGPYKLRFDSLSG